MAWVRDVRLCADATRCAFRTLIWITDDFISTGEERWRNSEAERLGSFQVYYQLKLVGLFYGQVARFLRIRSTYRAARRRMSAMMVP
jgi:hypothetical protein